MIRNGPGRNCSERKFLGGKSWNQICSDKLFRGRQRIIEESRKTSSIDEPIREQFILGLSPYDECLRYNVYLDARQLPMK